MQCNKNRYLFTPLHKTGKKERKTKKNKQLLQIKSQIGKLWNYNLPTYALKVNIPSSDTQRNSSAPCHMAKMLTGMPLCLISSIPRDLCPCVDEILGVCTSRHNTGNGRLVSEGDKYLDA